MSLAAVTILLLATQILATEQSVKLRTVTKIKTSSLETQSHCIDYKNFVYSTSARAISFDDSSRRFGAVDCLHGDIVLAGTYINLGNRILCQSMPSSPCIRALYDGVPLLSTTKSWIIFPGIHNAGSYGTRAIVKAADGSYENQLGLIADYNRTGWSNGFGGDYVMTNRAIEGTGRISPCKYVFYGWFTEATHILVILTNCYVNNSYDDFYGGFVTGWMMEYNVGAVKSSFTMAG